MSENPADIKNTEAALSSSPTTRKEHNRMTASERIRAAQVGRHAIFTRAKGTTTRPRRMHAVVADERKTVCGLGIGIGTSFVRDGDYHHNSPCPDCWSA